MAMNNTFFFEWKIYYKFYACLVKGFIFFVCLLYSIHWFDQFCSHTHANNRTKFSANSIGIFCNMNLKYQAMMIHTEK